MAAEFTPEELATINYYDQTAEEWSKAHSDTNFWASELQTFQRYLPKGYILEVGSGGGRDAELLSRAGYDYLGVDISEGLLKQARLRNPHLTFVKKSVYDLQNLSPFDGFWYSATILHLPKARALDALKSIHGVIRPRGVGFITIKEGSGDMVPEEEIIDGVTVVRHFSSYQPEEFGALLDESGYKTLERQRRVDSPRSTWLIYYLRVQK